VPNYNLLQYMKLCNQCYKIESYYVRPLHFTLGTCVQTMHNNEGRRMGRCVPGDCPRGRAQVAEKGASRSVGGGPGRISGDKAFEEGLYVILRLIAPAGCLLGPGTRQGTPGRFQEGRCGNS